MTIIIVEGVDLSGKTTAIEKISKHFNSGLIIKNSFKPKTSKDNDKLYGHYWHIINLASSMQDVNNDLILLDRLYPSQAVYSYLRGKDEIDCLDIKNLDKYCSEIKIKMIYIDTPLKELTSRYIKRGDEHISIEMLNKIKTRYEVFLGLSRLEILKLDTRKENWLKRVEEFIR